MFTVLIVDDCQADREGIRDIIDWASMDIVVVGLAIDGTDGYQKALELKPDIIVTDISMPVLDGIKMTDKIRLQLPQTKFIFMSCFDEFEFAKSAIHLDVCAYILKPIDIDELTGVIRKIVSERKEEAEKDEINQQLREKLAETLPVLQEQFIRDLLYGKIKDPADIAARADYIGIRLKKFYLLSLLEIDNYDLMYSNIQIEQKFFLAYQIKKYIDEIVLSESTGYVTIQQYNSIVLLVFSDLEDKEQVLDHVLDFLNRCKEVINDTLKTSVTIGIGGVSQDISHISVLYESASHAVKSKFFSKDNSIILANELKDASVDLYYDLKHIKKELGTILEGGRKEDIVFFVANYYVADLCFSQSYIKSLSFSIVNIVQIILIEKNESFESIFNNDVIVWEKLSKFETIIDIKQWITNILEAVREFLEQKNDGRYQKIVDDIKVVIKEKYGEIENVNQIVDPLYISASHANFIFKKYTGMTIFDYLIQIRMEAARKMLEDPYARIYEISDKVGYRSKTYFATVFKEYMGLTPKEYRDKYSG